MGSTGREAVWPSRNLHSSGRSRHTYPAPSECEARDHNLTRSQGRFAVCRQASHLSVQLPARLETVTDGRREEVSQRKWLVARVDTAPAVLNVTSLIKTPNLQAPNFEHVAGCRGCRASRALARHSAREASRRECRDRTLRRVSNYAVPSRALTWASPILGVNSVRKAVTSAAGSESPQIDDKGRHMLCGVC